jgi:hypothetical protein
MKIDSSVDKLVLNKHEALLLRLLMREWETLAEQAHELRKDRVMCSENNMEKAADAIRCLFNAVEVEKSAVVKAADFLSGGIDDVLFGDEKDWLIRE